KLGKSSLEYLHILEYHLPFNHRRYTRELLRTSCYGDKITEYEGDILQYSMKKSYYLFNYFDVHSEFIPSTNCCIKSPSPARELKDSTK
ncbi:conserved hypothetical protein, partial [Trichinella spiralis]|uniref:hypothetical protein n=1 Tax=Trichinella spiralis TaxID=6334 RepID=UPI0001EFD652